MDRINPLKTIPAARMASRVRQVFELGESACEGSEIRRLVPAWCFVTFSAVCVCVMLFAGALSSVDCRVTPIPLVLGSDYEISIRLPVGLPCTILVRPGGMIVESITIGVPPERGTLMLRGRTGVIYRPHLGFSGEDSFSFWLSSRSGSGSSTIRVRARVG
jgi:hypothetical protein